MSAVGAEWIHTVARSGPRRLRRRLAAELQAGGKDGQASTIKHTRWALVKNPQDLSPVE